MTLKRVANVIFLKKYLSPTLNESTNLFRIWWSFLFTLA